MTAMIVVEPGYGWGWTNGNATLDTPKPFKATVSRTGGELHGMVSDPGHPYHGSTLTLSRRHTTWDGSVNVEIRGMNRPTIYGYANIPLECFS